MKMTFTLFPDDAEALREAVIKEKCTILSETKGERKDSAITFTIQYKMEFELIMIGWNFADIKRKKDEVS